MKHSVIAVVIGMILAALLAAALDLPSADAIQLVALSFGSAALCYAAGSILIASGARRVSIAAATAVVALIPIASVAIGSLAAAKAMFVSTHDLSALVVIVVGSSTAGILGALALGRRLATARREADDAINRQRRLEQSRRELVAWVSHDLRTPLAGIRAMVESIQDGVVDDDETIDRFHLQIGRDVETLSQLIDDLFELSRIDADALELTLEPVSVGAVVSDAVAAVSSIARVKQVSVAVNPPDGVHPVAGSTRELTRVVHNLLDNAIRHTPRGGSVSVTVVADGGDAVISVRDECGGIPESDIDRVFDVAYSGDHARSPGTGTGLGLAIARGFVEAHRGQIDVLNLDEGCCFSVRLPLIAP